MIDMGSKERMIEFNLKQRGIGDQEVLKAMEKVPREEFVLEGHRAYAYLDEPLRYKCGQTISQPYIVALMTQSLRLNKKDKVLEIGTGTGYQAAVLAEIVTEVYTIENIEKLALEAEERLKRLSYNNIKVMYGDGCKGWPEYAPYDAIMITAAADNFPQPLIKQLKDKGRMVVPINTEFVDHQTLILLEKEGETFRKQGLIPVRFVPLTEGLR